jgi:DAK2 domain fusion protein YloV
MSDLEAARALARASLASLERSRRRIDDLNVYPVPDGDTGTNLALTARAIVEALEGSDAPDRETLARELTRAALMGARGNSGVILSQIVRGFAEAIGGAERIDAEQLGHAFRSASDAAYRAVRRPVEGTMLTVIREVAQAAEDPRRRALAVPELLAELVHAADESVAGTQEQLDVLRNAGVVDAGGAGLAEILRGLAAGVAGEPVPEPPEEVEELSVDAIHQELSRYRYCTVFVVEGDELDADALEAQLEPLGDSLLVVGDRTALKIHVHTDEPGTALSAGTAVGVIDGVEINNMHEQTVRREERLLHALPDPVEVRQSAVVAVAAGDGNRVLFESMGAASIVEGGQTMNPSTADLVAAVDGVDAAEAILLPNNSNVILSAEQAAPLAGKPVEVVTTDSIQAGLAAMVAYQPDRTATENAREMREAVAAVVTGEVTIASRDASLDGLAVRKGNYFGLAAGEAVAEGPDFGEVARAVVERLLLEPRGVLTLLTGEGAPDLGPLLALIGEQHPDVEVDVQEGGQPHYPLLVSAE